MMKCFDTTQYAIVSILLIAVLGLVPAFAEEQKSSDADTNTVSEPESETATGAIETTDDAVASGDNEVPESEASNESTTQSDDASPVTSSNMVNGFDCDGKSWVLGEAGRARGATVTFNPRWQDMLEKIAGCKAQMIKQARCLRLQGHYDSYVFGRDVVRVFGTQEVAQMTRARSRAQTVEAHLETLGFPGALIVRRSPPAVSSFRGVLVDYEEDCFGAKQYVDADPIPEPVVEVVTIIEDVEPAAQSMPEPMLTPMKKMTRDLWTQLDAGALYLDDRDGVAGLQTALHLGWTYRGLYVKVLGTMSGTNEELHRAGYGGQAGFGVHTPWTDLGIVAGIRNNARGLADPVGDQIQFVGVDAQQCVWRFGSFALCLREAYAPLTRMERQLALDNGALVRINSVTTQPMQFELAASIRYYFGEAQ